MRNVTEGVDGYSAEEWAKFLRWEDEQRSMMGQCFDLYRKHIKVQLCRSPRKVYLIRQGQNYTNLVSSH